jgi:hypothetical protein
LCDETNNRSTTKVLETDCIDLAENVEHESGQKGRKNDKNRRASGDFSRFLPCESPAAGKTAVFPRFFHSGSG